MKKWQSRFVGHDKWRGGIEHLMAMGKINGRRDRGTQREKIFDGLHPGLGAVQWQVCWDEQGTMSYGWTWYPMPAGKNLESTILHDSGKDMSTNREWC